MLQGSKSGASKCAAFAVFCADGRFLQRFGKVSDTEIYGPSPVPMERKKAVQGCRVVRASGIAAWLIPAVL